MESVCTGDRTEGSNPSPSATITELSQIQYAFEEPVRFEIELTALFCRASNDPVDQSAQRRGGRLMGNVVGVERGLQVVNLAFVDVHGIRVPFDFFRFCIG